MSNNLVIILTGCDSGFGAEIAEDLYRRDGYIIYATCLTQAAVDRYNGLNSDRVRASIVDVTKQADIDALQKLVEKQCPQGVYCLFHNAGVVAGNFLDLSTVENFDNNMQVNYMGLVRLTIAFLPSLRTYAKNRLNTSLPRARLLCTTSIAGRINVRGMAGYCASKQAAESFLDSMRVELSPWEIDVSILEPYNTRTTLIATTASNFERNWKDAPLSPRKMYGLEFR
ncbi:hypothetical protein K7432_007630 [Basidiobolus ranarum]|uniref:Uncharacterized protein n=1 Tax=Basidiobolus ranarum TaxID=34480 RepID=A0ABR2WT36_9FUNG